MILIGTAGWGIPRAEIERLPREGTHLQRYAGAMGCVEINSCFYRPHRLQTYERWVASVPQTFRFSVKLPRALTHEARLQPADDSVLDRFLSEVAGLGAQLGPLLVQMPRSLEFDVHVADCFFAMLRERWNGAIVVEPRHASWFSRAADRLLGTRRLGRVAADPPLVPATAHPLQCDSGGASDPLFYYRLHGSPRTYWSPYSTDFLARLAVTLRILARGATVWCIFDNTASGSALRNALDLQALLDAPKRRSSAAEDSKQK